MYLILILATIKLIHQILFFLYLFQRKEYRLDRLKEHTRRVYKNPFNSWYHLTVGTPIDSILLKLPKPSFKAIVIIVFSLCLIGLLFIIEPSLIFLVLFFSPSIVIFSWLLILPFETIYKAWVFSRAKNKIANYKKNHKLIVIGITGSYGKTTTKTFVTALLQSKFSVVTTPKSINTPLGIARIILNNIKPSHSFFVVEMGAYKKGEINELCQITQPDIGVLTGISDQHLALFGSQKNIILAKSELIEALPKNGFALINKNSECKPIIQRAKVKKIIWYSQKDIPKNVSIKQFPKTALENLPAACIIAQHFGLTKKEISDALKAIQLPPTALKIVYVSPKLTLIDDTSNANTKGFFDALKILKNQRAENKIIVTPCVIELGPKGPEFHRKIARFMKTVANHVIFTTKDYEQDIRKGWGNSKKKRLHFIENPENVIEYLKPLLQNKCAILLEGKINDKIIHYVINQP